MRTPRFTDSQILAIFKQDENSVAVQNLCREHSTSSATFHTKFGGMDASLIRLITVFFTRQANNIARSKDAAYYIAQNNGIKYFGRSC